MDIRESAVTMGAALGYRALRFLVSRLSDRNLARALRGAERLAYAASGDLALKSAVAELADIFESGPPFSTTARGMFKDDESETAVSAIRCLARKSPHGAA